MPPNERTPSFVSPQPISARIQVAPPAGSGEQAPPIPVENEREAAASARLAYFAEELVKDTPPVLAPQIVEQIATQRAQRAFATLAPQLPLAPEAYEQIASGLTEFFGQDPSASTASAAFRNAVMTLIGQTAGPEAANAYAQQQLEQQEQHFQLGMLDTVGAFSQQANLSPAQEQFVASVVFDTAHKAKEATIQVDALLVDAAAGHLEGDQHDPRYVGAAATAALAKRHLTEHAAHQIIAADNGLLTRDQQLALLECAKDPAGVAPGGAAAPISHFEQ